MKAIIIGLICTISLTAFGQTNQELIGVWKFKNVVNQNDSVIEELKGNTILTLKADLTFVMQTKDNNSEVTGTWSVSESNLVLKNNSDDPFEATTEKLPISSLKGTSLFLVKKHQCNHNHSKAHTEEEQQLLHLIKLERN